MDELSGKIALVTGAGRGLGQAISLLLAEHGAAVASADLREEGAYQTAEKIKDHGGRALPLAFDAADEQAGRRALDRIGNSMGPVDILINNAGTDVTLPIEELTFEDWDRVIRTNLRAPFVLSKLVFSEMARRRSGSIINIASTAAKRAWANASVYHASKWGLLGFSHALHVEGRKANIKVSAVIAGGMRTPFLLDRFPDLDPDVLQAPESAAKTVLFLLLQPPETVIPEVTVIPMRESSWP